jgi:hypothetical protein
MGCNVRFLIAANVQYVITLTELQSVKSGPKAFVQLSPPQSYQNEQYQKLLMWVCYIIIALDINKYIVQKQIYAVDTVNIYSIGLYVH